MKKIAVLYTNHPDASHPDGCHPILYHVTWGKNKKYYASSLFYNCNYVIEASSLEEAIEKMENALSEESIIRR